MEWNILAVLLIVGLTSVAGQPDGTMMCFVTTINNVYTAVVSVTNPGGQNNFQECTPNHNPGLSNDDVMAIQVTGNTRNIPTAVCQSFPNAQTLTAINIQLNQTNDLYDCINLKELDLSNNIIVEIDANAFTNTHLTRINLSRNAISYTHDRSLANLKNLEVLDLSHNPDIPIRDGFFQYAVHLQELYLSNSELSVLRNRWFYNLTQLILLDISHNPLVEIPVAALRPLTNLQILHMNDCEFSRLYAETFHYNSDLVYLDMSSNELVNLEGNLLASQDALVTLLLSHNALEPLPAEIFQSLVSLQILEMNNCTINKLEVSWFASMSQLRILSMWRNFISEIPYKTLGVENNLEQLYLQNNQLRVLDATSFALLKNLKELRMDNNRIYAVDAHFIQQPEALNTAWFLNNECVDENIDRFHENREDNLMLFDSCFHHFDKIPVIMDTTPDEDYRWYSMRWETLVLHVKAAENVSIIFSDMQSEELGKTLKIQLGMDRNFYTFVYENGTLVWEALTDGILDEFEWRSFVITWRSNVLQMYEKDWQLPLATHTILKPFEINFFGVRSDSPASFHVLRVESNFKHAEFPNINPLTTTTPWATTSYPFSATSV